MPTTLAIFSDVHANLPALEAVLRDIDVRMERGDVDAAYCLGDLVGYCTWPNEVVQTIHRRSIPTIAGNYDEGVGLSSDDCGCAYQTEEDRARGVESITWTNGAVNERTRRYLRALPRHLRLTVAAPRQPDRKPLDVLLVHGSPRRVNEYLFADRPETSMLRLMQEAGADVLLCGHTHKPYHRALAYTMEDGTPAWRHVINTGAVGKPKDGDPRACYVLLTLDPERPAGDREACRVEFARVPYDVEMAATAIEASPLPHAFADMLREAR